MRRWTNESRQIIYIYNQVIHLFVIIHIVSSRRSHICGSPLPDSVRTVHAVRVIVISRTQIYIYIRILSEKTMVWKNSFICLVHIWISMYTMAWIRHCCEAHIVVEAFGKYISRARIASSQRSYNIVDVRRLYTYYKYDNNLIGACVAMWSCHNGGEWGRWQGRACVRTPVVFTHEDNSIWARINKYSARGFEKSTGGDAIARCG